MKLICSLAVIVLSLTTAGFSQGISSAITNNTNEIRFLEQNKERDGVKVTKSGLQYEVIKEGSGQSPTADNSVTVQYEGKLLNGSVFDSSYRRGQPATFGVSNVIRGWTEGLQLMKPGASYIFYIPAKLAYGIDGAPPSIGPNECLIFRVELISVQ